MNRELADVYLPLMDVIEGTVMNPLCAPDVATQLVELYFFLLLLVTGIESRAEVEAALLRSGVDLNARPEPVAALEMFAQLRSEFLSRREDDGQQEMIH